MLAVITQLILIRLTLIAKMSIKKNNYYLQNTSIYYMNDNLHQKKFYSEIKLKQLIK